MRERFPLKALFGGLPILLAWWIGTSNAAESLAEAMQQLRSPDILISDAAVEDIVRAGPLAVDSLLAVLGDSRRDVRAGAIRGLGLLGDPRAVPPLLRLLEGSLERRKPDTFEDRYLRILSIQSLGRLRAKEAARILERASKGDAFEEAQSAVALFQLQESLGYSLVEKCLSDTTLAIRNLVVEGISEENSPEAKKILIEATKDPSWVVRDTAYRGLGNWKSDSEVAEVLLAGESDSSWFVRETVKQTRGRTGPE
jgi:HEAT repeat protein